MRAVCIAIVASLCVAVCNGAAAKYDPHSLSKWGGACATGKMQSPINIDAKMTRPVPESFGKVKFGTFGVVKDYTVYFTGASLEVGFEKFSTPTDVSIPANDYTIGKSKTVKRGDPLKVTPLQMHFHTVSEHTFEGFYAPAELHIVTKVDDGQSDHCDENGPCLAVFGIMFTYSGQGKKPINALKKLFKQAPSGVGAENGFTTKRPLKLDDFLPDSLNYYTYLGSLTTPPCSEIVTWHVFREDVEISAEMIDSHQSMVSFTPGDDCIYSYSGVCTPPREKTNHRNVQPYYGRKVYFVEV